MTQINIFADGTIKKLSLNSNKLPNSVIFQGKVYRREIENYYIEDGNESSFYNYLSENYEKLIDYRLNHELYKILLSKIKGSKILDIGCGSGIILDVIRKFKKQNIELVLLDISENMIKLAKKKAEKYNIKNIKFVVKDFLKYNTNEKFDYIFAVFSIPLTDTVIRKVKKLLKKGGKGYLIIYKTKISEKANKYKALETKVGKRVLKIFEIWK